MIVDYKYINSDPYPSRFAALLLFPVQGYAARNVSLAGVSSLTGLDRLEVGRLSLSGPSASSASTGGIVAGQMAVLTAKGELLSAGQAFSVEPETGTFLVPRIGAHDVTGNVDFLGNALLNAVLESPAIGYVSGSPTVLYLGVVTCCCGEALSQRLYDLFYSTTHRFVLYKLLFASGWRGCGHTVMHCIRLYYNGIVPPSVTCILYVLGGNSLQFRFQPALSSVRQSARSRIVMLVSTFTFFRERE